MTSDEDPRPRRFLRFPAWAWPLLALPLVAGVGVWTHAVIASTMRARLQASLKTLLASNASSVRQWLRAEANLAQVVTGDPRVAEDIASLIALGQKTGGDAAALKASPAQARLRQLLAPAVERQENAGYFVIDRGGLMVARSIDERVGDRVVAAVAEVAVRVITDGQPLFLPPTLKQRFTAIPMAFVMTPLRDAKGTIVAAFGFRILPEHLAALLNASRLGDTGETYAIDPDARMITESRVAGMLEGLGLLPPEAGGKTTAVLEVRDPGLLLVAGTPPRDPSRTWPLTRAASEAVAGRSGVSIDGYRNYRGMDVVGAWEWLPEWGMGIVSEIDRAEAYEPLAVIERAFRVLAGGLLLLAALIGVSSRRIHGLQKTVERAQRLGQYTLEEKVGEGGMGAVYKARHAFLRRPTAVKLIRAEVASPDVLARFEREVQLTSQLTHANTIAIYDYGKTPDGVFYYAMEYLPGLPLDQVILGDGPQTEARVVHLVEQMCASLGEAHRVGLVHRDIKPANVMLCERGGTYDVVKVLDFGLVKELGSHADAGVTAFDHLVGTPLYMAPEGVVSAANVSPRSDVYAVGAVAYALVTGQAVFSGSSAVEIISHHLNTAPVPPSERLGRPIAPVLERLIMACLAKRPEARPADAAALLTLLEEGWTEPRWSQRQAREWWEMKAPAMLAARREAIESVSRAPKLAVDVASRMSGSRSLPELSIVDSSVTAVSVRPEDRREG